MLFSLQYFLFLLSKLSALLKVEAPLSIIGCVTDGLDIGPFDDRTDPNDLKTKLISYLDSHCNNAKF